jgi:hypothetical protein
MKKASPIFGRAQAEKHLVSGEADINGENIAGSRANKREPELSEAIRDEVCTTVHNETQMISAKSFNGDKDVLLLHSSTEQERQAGKSCEVNNLKADQQVSPGTKPGCSYNNGDGDLGRACLAANDKYLCEERLSPSSESDEDSRPDSQKVCDQHVFDEKEPVLDEAKLDEQGAADDEGMPLAKKPRKRRKSRKLTKAKYGWFKRKPMFVTNDDVEVASVSTAKKKKINENENSTGTSLVGYDAGPNDVSRLFTYPLISCCGSTMNEVHFSYDSRSVVKPYEVIT